MAPADNGAGPYKSCQPPDPNPVKPGFQLPPGACDAHCHVFGPGDVFPYHPSRSYTPPDASRQTLKNLHDFLGLERAVIVQASCHGPDNTAMLDAIAHSNGKYRGVCHIDESTTEKDLHDLHDGGVRGVRFNFVKHLGGAPDIDFLRRTVDVIRGLDWHLVLHFDAADLLEYKSLLEELSIRIVIDHMGRPKVAEGVEQASFQTLLDFMKNENYWVKVCGLERISVDGAPFHDGIPFAQSLIEVAPDRIIWGTDFPHPNINGDMPNDGELVNLLGLVAPDETQRKKILVDNPHRLYEFES
ncbi:MAG: amidohydrolase family protein [Rhodospirillaceae bacterium]|jgi:2-pyrone-4,6-dicarboxylate lactonase|nr:amidohydrolase family protein [Rhodospirillaceae bacterium]MBT4588986.1 amidohydrolase family protein [Rhodospirillaceae bacterium]MBT5941954.1 amidohydrolase family protein [Rhodospirillaceae bacterium]MBT7268359.1 amidohydrolase family protein [Rhodospirillaceae bacterium]